LPLSSLLLLLLLLLPGIRAAMTTKMSRFDGEKEREREAAPIAEFGRETLSERKQHRL
jgi:hypothetical protein